MLRSPGVRIQCNFSRPSYSEVHSKLTFLVFKALPSSSALWTGWRVFLVLHKTGSAVDLSTTGQLLRVFSHKGTNETDEVIKRLFDKVAVISTKISSHIGTSIACS